MVHQAQNIYVSFLFFVSQAKIQNKPNRIINEGLETILCLVFLFLIVGVDRQSKFIDFVNPFLNVLGKWT